MIDHFGPVKVAKKTLVASGKVYSVTLQQQELHTDYTEPDVLSGKTHTTPPKTSRKVQVRVSLDEAANLEEGQIVAGHIMRTIHPAPTHKGQREAHTGGYPQAKWVDTYTSDVDLRTLTPAV